MTKLTEKDINVITNDGVFFNGTGLTIHVSDSQDPEKGILVKKQILENQLYFNMLDQLEMYFSFIMPPHAQVYCTCTSCMSYNSMFRILKSFRAKIQELS